MNLAAEAPPWLAWGLALLLVAGAAEDAARLRISNITCALILATAVVAMAISRPDLALWQNLFVFAVLLAAGTALFATGKFGGGDVKLVATTGLWFNINGGLLMLTMVLLAGGVLALLIIALRSFVEWGEGARRRIPVLSAGAGIPYGVAIAAGALIATVIIRS